MRAMEMRRELLLLAPLIWVTACGDSPEGRTYYERNIEPILIQKCAGNTSGCHAINVDAISGEPDPFAIAAGNLDVTSFENVQKRRDTLTSFGAYPYPLLLIKAVGPDKLQFQYSTDATTTFRPISVQHSGGGLIEVGSDAYFTLQSWLDNGATENGLRPATPAVTGNGACTEPIPAGFDAAAARGQPGFATFKSSVQPILSRHGCGAGSCHGAPQSDFFLTCGDDDDQVAFNFTQAHAFVHDTGMAGAPEVLDSQLLRVPLAVNGGGRGHTGGDQFASTDDPDFAAVRAWAESVGNLDFAQGDPLKQFFADHVQPIFVQRGCAFQACHSPQATNDFKLRSGSIGFFSSIALRKNYELFRNEFMAVEFPDARRGRAVAKGILDDDDQRVPAGVLGIIHRGGPVLETPGPMNGADPAACPTNFDPDVVPTTPFCIVQEWLRLERVSLVSAGQATDFAAGAKIVFVNRPAASANTGRLEFDTFRGGASLLAVDAAFNALGVITAPIDIGGATNLSTNCPGLGAGGDIQSPNVANDGDRVVFAARASAAEALGVFVVQISTGTCVKISAANPADSNGLKVHDFDPVFSPDGANVVFASTRGKAGALKSRKRLLPQSDLWRAPITGLTANLATAEQMTFLSNSEVGPAFMREGRVTMTTEKASTGFYQLAGRRINWDLTDYHPLLAQRKESLFVDPTMADLTTSFPSIGYSSATDIVESSDGDFLVVLTDVDPTTGAPVMPGAAGALGVFNRSIGPFEEGRADIGYLQALRILDAGTATGRTATGGGYRRPRILPDGRIMAAFAANASTGNFNIVMVDPRTQQRSPLLTGGADAQVDAVLAYKHPPRQLYANRRQLVFGGKASGGDEGVLHMPDAPMTFTMLVANLRRGRPVDEFGAARFLSVFSEGTCPTANCTAPGGLFESRTLLGRAPLSADGSVKVILPSSQGLVFQLEDGDGNIIVTMGEEHQIGPGEEISMGVSRQLFNGICGGCHGSISARELDVAVTPDALTGASQSLSLTTNPIRLQ